MMSKNRLQDIRVYNYIKLCVKDPFVLNHLLAGDFITEEQAGQIKAIYQERNHIQATGLLLDILKSSHNAGTIQALTDALRADEYPFLAKLLSDDEVVLTDERDHGRIMLQKFKPMLVHINVIDVLPSLFSEHLINVRDREQVLAYLASSGPQKAADELCDRVMTRKAPPDWYCDFLHVLNDNGHSYIVNKMEPDFLKNPDDFKRSYEKCCCVFYQSKEQNEWMASSSGEHDDRELSGATAYCMSEASMDNMCPPPPAKLDIDCNQDTSQSPGEFPDFTCPLNSLSPDCSSSPDTKKFSNLSLNLDTVNIRPESGDKDVSTLSFPTRKTEIDMNMLDNKTASSGPEDVKDENEEESNEDGEDNALNSDDDWLGYNPEETHLKLHDYQLELAEDALEGKNTIICAPTGCGKTWVAFYIVQEHLKKKKTDPKKVIFMARTGALVKQQADRFKKYLPKAETKLITGEDDDSKKVGIFLEHYDIVCMTPQILINNLDSGSVSGLSAISMLVLDECHHTKKDEPYNNLMKRYLDEKSRKPSSKLPQIIGMTASIGVGKSSTEEEACDYIVQMCARLDARVVSTVKRHIKQLVGRTVDTQDEIIKMQERINNPCEDLILSAIDLTEDMLKGLGSLEPTIIGHLCSIPPDKEGVDYQKWTVEVKKLAQHEIRDAGKSRDIQSCAMYLYSYNAALEVNRLLETKDVAQYLAEKLGNEEKQREKLNNTEVKLLNNLKRLNEQIIRLKSENPNVSVIVRILGSMLDQQGEESRAMVFVKQRATCRALAKFLDNALRPKGVRADALYGKEARGSEEGMTEAEQNEHIEKFRSGQLKILVATSVGTEGIDIPDNNIALSYNYSGNEITKVQIKGRIRKAGGTNIIMGTEKLVEKERMNAYKVALMHRGLNAFKQLDQRQIERKVKNYQDEELRNYHFKKRCEELSQKSKQSAADLGIQLLCRRCRNKVCSLNDIRTVSRQFIIIDPRIVDRAVKKPHRSPKKYEGFHKKYKMFCKACPMDWGIVSVKNGMDYYTVKLQNLLFLMGDGQCHSFPQWDKVPYDIPEFREEDLGRVFSEE